MKQRCRNENRPDYKYYGLKGIDYCEEWEKYEKFRDWALSNGYKYGLTIDRKDFTKGYYPDNCRFITLAEQQRNKSNNLNFTYMGRTKTLSEWAREYNTPFKTLKSRLELGYTFDEAINKKAGVLKTSKLYEVNGKKYTLTQLANKYEMSKNCLFGRLKRGLSLNEALTIPVKNKEE